MAKQKSSFLDKVLMRISRLDKEGLQTVIRRLARERSFLETVFNTIEDGVLVTDEWGKVVYLNRAVTQLLGVQSQAAEGEHIGVLLPQLEWDKVFETEREGGMGVVRHELEVQYPRPRLLSLYVAPLDSDDTGSSGLALIIHDVTEARAKTFAAIESERTQALTLLAASVAHEIGNPLNALHIHLQLMERELRKFRTVALNTPAVAKGISKEDRKRSMADCEDVAGKLDKYLTVAKGEITRLDYIITQFLQALRPVPPKIAITDVKNVVREAIELLRPEIENRGIALQEHLGDVPAIPIDPGQIKQVLVNLMKNAIQAMIRGGVLRLGAERASEGVCLTVADTGGGIPPEKLNRIFEPFYTTKKKGTGLGLMIVQRIVRDHGGRIELDSRVNQGTTFRIWLPLHERGPRLLHSGGKEQEADASSTNAAML